MSAHDKPLRRAPSDEERPQTSRLVWQETQHRRLFVLLDALGGEQDFRTVLQELNRYAEEHFAIEEQYMAALAFPGESAHRRAHDKFRNELKQLDAADADDRSLREMTAMFLREWLMRHIYGIDQELEEFIVNSSLK